MRRLLEADSEVDARAASGGLYAALHGPELFVLARGGAAFGNSAALVKLLVHYAAFDVVKAMEERRERLGSAAAACA